MIVRSEDFLTLPPEWMADTTVSAELKQKLRERGMAEAQSRVECLEIVVDCFNCGEKLATPYIYCHGVTGTFSLQVKCALDVARCLKIMMPHYKSVDPRNLGRSQNL